MIYMRELEKEMQKKFDKYNAKFPGAIDKLYWDDKIQALIFEVPGFPISESR